MEEKVPMTIDLNNRLSLRFNELKVVGGREKKILAYEIFHNGIFQECFIHKETVDGIKEQLKSNQMTMDEMTERLTEIAENTIKMAKGTIE